jgi:hypothetical protein
MDKAAGLGVSELTGARTVRAQGGSGVSRFVWQVLATVWIIGATVIWSRFFMAPLVSDEGAKLFNEGYAWLAVGAGLTLLRLVWKEPRA